MTQVNFEYGIYELSNSNEHGGENIRDDSEDTDTPLIGASTDPNKLANGDDGYGNGRCISADEYFQRMRHTPVRGCRWRAEDWQEQLTELGKDPIRHAERRFVSLINEDHGELAGAAPGIFIGI